MQRCFSCDIIYYHANLVAMISRNSCFYGRGGGEGGGLRGYRTSLAGC